MKQTVIIPIRTKQREVSDEMLALSKQLTKLIQTAIVSAGVDKTSNLVQKTVVGYAGVDDADLNLIWFMEKHAVFVDAGRKKYPLRGVKFNGPFFTAILDWVKKKKLQQKFKNKKGQFMTNNTIAYIICRAINKNGIKARPFIETGKDIMNKGLQYLIDNQLIKIITEDLSQNLEKI